MYPSFTGTFGTWCCDSEIGNVMMYNRKMASLYNRINQVYFQSIIGRRTKKSLFVTVHLFFLEGLFWLSKKRIAFP